mmetsp:Transcript_19750/g.50144  ORF Transcript_19750/g.50144 Transcript_19750/m.50144 type:complete len:202 (-) Transcript_19750:33-638(-)
MCAHKGKHSLPVSARGEERFLGRLRDVVQLGLRRGGKRVPMEACKRCVCPCKLCGPKEEKTKEQRSVTCGLNITAFRTVRARPCRWIEVHHNGDIIGTKRFPTPRLPAGACDRQHWCSGRVQNTRGISAHLTVGQDGCPASLLDEPARLTQLRRHPFRQLPRTHPHPCGELGRRDEVTCELHAHAPLGQAAVLHASVRAPA